MKIRPVRAELFHVDRRTDRQDKVTNRFSKFWESAKNHKSSIIVIFYKCPCNVLFTMQMYHICNLKKENFPYTGQILWQISVNLEFLRCAIS